MKQPKPKKCKFCGKQFVPTVSTTQVTCYSLACTIGYTEAKKAAKRKKEHARAKREYYDNDRSTQIEKAQKSFNAFIRERDKDQPCISCGRYHKGQYHAGHYRTRKAAPQLRFNQFNTNRQCAPCNRNLSGNITLYRIALIKKWGEEKVLELECNNEIKTFTIDELRAICNYYKKLKKELQDGCYVQGFRM